MPQAKTPITERLRGLFSRHVLRKEEDATAEALSAALRDPGTSPVFFRTLLNSPLHALSFKGELLQYSDTNGEAFIPVFTRASLLPQAPEGASPVEKPGREILELTRDLCRVVINAGQKEFKAFGPDDITRILDHLVKSRFEV